MCGGTKYRREKISHKNKTEKKNIILMQEEAAKMLSSSFI